jgi:aminoglycoside phosphotransferase family enzyme
MSWLFLTDAFVYKLKKPVRYPFLDFSSIEARKLNCEREVTLNRRLASDVYLGAVPLTVDAHGNLHLAGRGRVVDWLVHMRRLPAEQTLECAVIEHRVRETDIRRVVERLAEFYGRAAPVAIDPLRYRHRFEEEALANRSELAQPRFGLAVDVVERLGTAQLALLAARGDLLEERAQTRKIVEGHGDLRPEHIYLASDPIVMDCLEFNRDFRILDPADELAYLAMECDRLGATFIDDWLFATYCDRTNDRFPRILVEFYKCARAYLRAKIAIWHLDEPEVREPSKWTRRAHEYLQLAQEYAGRLT